MAVDTTELWKLGERLRRGNTNRDVLEYIDGTMPLLVGKPVVYDEKKVDARIKSLTCPVCEARRKAKREAQRRWRAKGV